MSYLHYYCLFAYSGVQRILCFSFVCLRLVYPMLPVSLYYSLLIAPSVFSNVYSINHYIILHSATNIRCYSDMAINYVQCSL